MPRPRPYRAAAFKLPGHTPGRNVTLPGSPRKREDSSPPVTVFLSTGSSSAPVGILSGCKFEFLRGLVEPDSEG